MICIESKTYITRRLNKKKIQTGCHIKLLKISSLSIAMKRPCLTVNNNVVGKRSVDSVCPCIFRIRLCIVLFALTLSSLPSVLSILCGPRVGLIKFLNSRFYVQLWTKMSSSFEQMRANVGKLLRGIDRYGCSYDLSGLINR